LRRTNRQHSHAKIKQGVCYTMALPFYIKKYLKAKGEE